MKLPLSWLKKYIDVSLSAERLAEALTLSGSKVESVEQKAGDWVIDIEVTSNRPDCLSVLGMAREVSAVSGRKASVPHEYKVLKGAAAAKISQKNGFDLLIEDKKGCPRYTARVIRGVAVAPSPKETQRLLEAVGIRPISNVVDATNFVMMECGQPMHAFDLDQIEGGRVIVRRSRAGEKFIGIDGNEYTLDNQTLVIADLAKPIAIAGVIGGKLTEVTHQTKNILLESAYFDPMLVRQASKKYKVGTESSYRFERGVEAGMVAAASLRAKNLIIGWAGGAEPAGLMDVNTLPKKSIAKVVLDLNSMESVLGYRVAPAKCVKILKALSFGVQGGKSRLVVTVPAHRRDVSMEADLIEEVLRVAGFDNIPSTLPATRYSETPVRDQKARGVFALKKFLAANGFDEIMTYSLLSGKKLQDAGFEVSGVHKMVNPVSAEQEYFRPTLLVGMLDSMLFNVHRKAHSIKFFEIGNRYLNGREEKVLALGLFGSLEENWGKKTAATYYDLKGLLANIFDYLHITPAEDASTFSKAYFGFGCDCRFEGKEIGSFGEVAEAVRKRWDIPQSIFYAEILLDDIVGRAVPSIRVKESPKYPGVRRDIAFLIDQRVTVNDLQNSMLNAGSPYLISAELFDQYSGKNIPAGKRSLAFSLHYQNENGTFTDPEIQSLQQRVTDSLKEHYQVEFR